MRVQVVHKSKIQLTSHPFNPKSICPGSLDVDSDAEESKSDLQMSVGRTGAQSHLLSTWQRVAVDAGLSKAIQNNMLSMACRSTNADSWRLCRFAKSQRLTHMHCVTHHHCCQWWPVWPTTLTLLTTITIAGVRPRQWWPHHQLAWRQPPAPTFTTQWWIFRIRKNVVKNVKKKLWDFDKISGWTEFEVLSIVCTSAKMLSLHHYMVVPQTLVWILSIRADRMHVKT